MFTDGGIATVIKFITDILTGPPYAQVGISCKEVLRLPPTPLYLGHPHNIHLECVTSEHFIQWCENVKILCP